MGDDARKFRQKMRSSSSNGELREGLAGQKFLYRRRTRERCALKRRRNADGGAPAVVIAASDSATLAGMRIALVGESVRVRAEARSLRELVQAVERYAPDVCLIDAELERGGVRAAAEIVARAPRVAVVLLAAEADEEQFLDAMRAGAAGYVPKNVAPVRLPNIVRAVMKGEPAVPRSLVMPLIHEYRQRGARRHLAVPNGRGVDLTSREWQVLDFMREGLSTRQIAARLLISEVTVRRHISSVLKKLDVETRADALKLLQTA
jgi:DNA-binding NarL/FixJ family response regulator